MPGPLGWHQHHDPRSRAFGIVAHPAVDLAQPLVSKRWGRTRTPLDQGQLGSCTGNACCRMLAEMPGHSTRVQYTESTALRLYKLATVLDNVAGHYPPDDTGSTTVAVLKAAQQLGWVKTYRWAFSLDEALHSLSSVGPLITGIEWTEGCDRPDARGLITPAGAVRGGHELVVDEVDTLNEEVAGWQSWGPDWPAHGRWRMKFAVWGALLAAGGEVGIGLAA